MSTLEQDFVAARKLHEVGRLRDAEAAYREILSADPENTECLHMLGVAVAQFGRLGEAIELLREAIERNPDNSEFHSNLGEVLRLSHKKEEAAAAFRKALEVDEDNFEANLSLSSLVAELGQLTDALGLARKAAELRPSNATAQVSYGDFLRLTDDLVGAMAAADRALEIVPDYEKALNLRGLVLREQGRFEEAIPLFEAGLRANRLSAANRLNLAASLTAVGRYEEATKAFQEHLRLGDRDPSPFVGLGQINRLRGEHLAAERWLREGLDAFPQYRALRYELGLTLVAMGQLDEAGEHLASAANGTKPLPSANISYGKFLLQVGRLAEAAEQFEMALSKRPDNEAAANGLVQARGEKPIEVIWDEDTPATNHSSETA